MLWLSAVTRVTALLLPALTAHPAGVVRVIHYWLHLWVDRALGVVFITTPSAFHFTGLDAWYYWVLAAAILLRLSSQRARGERRPARTSTCGLPCEDRFDFSAWIGANP